MAEATITKVKKTPKTAPSEAMSSNKNDTKGFAVIATGGNQYIVAPGDTLRIEKILGDHKVGDIITFDQVLITDNGSESVFGTPFISNGKVTAEILEIARAKKIVVIKYKQKSRYFKKNGHKQPYFKIKINTI